MHANPRLMVQNVHYTPEMIGSEGVKVKADLDDFFYIIIDFIKNMVI
jgi:hypothetical protein